MKPQVPVRVTLPDFLQLSNLNCLQDELIHLIALKFVLVGQWWLEEHLACNSGNTSIHSLSAWILPDTQDINNEYSILKYFDIAWHSHVNDEYSFIVLIFPDSTHVNDEYSFAECFNIAWQHTCQWWILIHWVFWYCLTAHMSIMNIQALHLRMSPCG